MTKNGMLFGLCCAVLAASPSPATAEGERTLVWLTADRAPSDAVRLEVEASGYTLVLADAPTGDDGGARLANARARGHVLGGAYTIYIEAEGTPTVFVIAEDGTIAHAPLSNTRFTQRALALVAMSLVEELSDRVPAVSLAPPPPNAPEVVVEPPAAPSAAEANPAVSGEPNVTQLSVIDTSGVTTTDDGAVVPPTVVIVDAPPGSEVAIEVRPSGEAEAETPAPVVDAADVATHEVFFGADVVPFLGTSIRSRGYATRRLSLNLLVGFDGGLNGFELGGLANIHRGNVRGVQVAGIMNANGGSLRGVQLSSGLNYVGGNALGAQLSDVNIVRGILHGAQLGTANYVGGDLDGVQLAVGNLTRGDLEGAQLGTINYAGSVRGLQLGVLNITGGELHGLQLGTVNIARGRGGVQVGLVNVSNDADFAFGLLNIVRNGRTQIEITSTDAGFVFAAVKHGGRHFHSIYSVGARASRDEPVGAIGLGFGVRATPGERFFVDVDLTGHVLVDDATGGNDDVESLTSVRAMLGIRLIDNLALVFGPSYNALITPRTTRTNGWGLIDATSHHDGTGTGGSRVLGWPGLVLGIQVL